MRTASTTTTSTTTRTEHRRASRVLALALGGLLLLAALPAAGQASGATTDRIAGTDRITTAIAIADRSFPDTAEVVYLARADNPADALAAGTLVDGPTLLVPTCGPVPPEVTATIARLDPDQVIALGGTAAICDQLLDDAADGRPTDRLAGTSRQTTSYAIATRAFPTGAPTAYLANPADSPDAVAGGALTDGPILLLPATGTDPLTVELDRLDPTRVIALGGTAAIGDDQLAAAADGRPTDRLAGDSRFATATAIAAAAFPDGTGTVYLARADVFADALAAGSLTDGPVLLIPQCGDLPPATATYLTDTDPDQLIALGGPGAVCDQILATAAGQISAPPTPPPPPPGDGTLPPIPTSGTLYYSWNGSFYSYDIATGFETKVHDDFTAYYTLAEDGTEFVSTDDDTVTIRDTVTTDITDQFELPYTLARDGGREVPELSPDRARLGTLAFHLDEAGETDVDRRDLVIVDRSGAIVGVIPLVRSYTWTPAGDLLVATEQTDPPSVGIVRGDVGVTGGALDYTPLTSFGAWEDLPVQLDVSADSSRVVYTAGSHLSVLALDGSAPPRQVTTSASTESEATFSPDGRHIVFKFGVATFSGPAVVIPADLAEPIRIPVGGAAGPGDPLLPYPLRLADETGRRLAVDGTGIFWRP